MGTTPQPARRYLQTSRKTRSIMAFTRVTAFVALALLGCALADDFRVEEANPRTDNNGNLYGLDVKSDGQMFLFIIKDKLPQGALSEGQEYFPVSNIYKDGANAQAQAAAQAAANAGVDKNIQPLQNPQNIGF